MDTYTLPTERHLFLTGRPPIADFVRFMKRSAIDGPELDEKALTTEWQEANARVRALQTNEAGFADTPEPEDLPQALASHAQRELEALLAERGPTFLPYRWAMVELDRLIVFQKVMNLTFAEELKSVLPEAPTSEDLVTLALKGPQEPPSPRFTQLDGNSFTYSSASNDLRVLGISPLDPQAVRDKRSWERASALLGIFIGYGANLMQAFRMRKRTVLSNGSHRAYALRSLGITHVPCLIQHVANEDDLELVAVPEIRQNLERYFGARRPPLFKDYFDPQLHRVIDVPRRNMMLQVEVTIRQSVIPSI